MGTVTLEQIHKDLVEIKKDIKYLKTIAAEDLELSDEVTKLIEDSRKRPIKEFISNEEMEKEFG
jgi:hypothetical protein